MDNFVNFGYSLVASAPTPATSGTSLVVTAGGGLLMPTPPFNAVLWPASALALSSNAEIVRVTAISTDTLTIVRAQEGTTARTVANGWQVAAAITAKLLTDLRDGIEGGLAGTSFRIKDGKAYFKNPGGGGTPWHELIPIIVDGVLNFDINPTGVI